MNKQSARIRQLNDHLRCHHRGGTVMLTAGVRAKGAEFLLALDQALAQHTFDAGDDPYGEHDFGAVKLLGSTVFFKIDYYDLDLRYASPDPADEAVTYRVMTIMLAEEY